MPQHRWYICVSGEVCNCSTIQEHCYIRFLILCSHNIRFIWVLSDQPKGALTHSALVWISLCSSFLSLTLIISSPSICGSRFSGNTTGRKLRALGLTIYHISLFERNFRIFSLTESCIKCCIIWNVVNHLICHSKTVHNRKNFLQ